MPDPLVRQLFLAINALEDWSRMRSIRCSLRRHDLTVLESSLTFSCLRSTPHNFTNLPYPGMSSHIECKPVPDSSPCEMPKETFSETGLKGSGLTFLAIDTVFTYYTSLWTFRHSNNYRF